MHRLVKYDQYMMRMKLRPLKKTKGLSQPANPMT